MLIPIINLIIKDNEKYKNYNKTIFLEMEDLSLILKNSEKGFPEKSCFTYEILEPIKMPEKTFLKYDDYRYIANLKVPIFLANEKEKREEYIHGNSGLIDLVKFPSIENPGKYNVEELSIVTFAGTRNKEDEIYISLSLYNGFPETDEANKLIKLKDRYSIKDNIRDKSFDDIIENINSKRKENSLKEIQYEYHIFENKSYLMNFNFYELLKENKEKLNKRKEIDLSIFDYLSTNLSGKIILRKNELLKSNLSIVLNKNQFNRLSKMSFTEQTWKKYLKEEIFIVR